MKGYLKIIILIAIVSSTISLNAQQSIAQGVSTSVSKEDILTQQRFYYQRDKYFSEISEMKGKYKIFNSGSEGMFHPLYIPRHKGVRRIGYMPFYDSRTTPGKRGAPIKIALSERLLNDSKLYSNLKLVNIMSSHIVESKLKQDDSGKPVYSLTLPKDLYHVGEFYSPRIHLQSLAAGLFTPDTYEKYFCSKAGGCQVKYSANRSLISWGGAEDNFKANRIFYEFVENQVAKIKLWACELNHSVYIVGITYLGQYDFDKKGFSLNLLHPHGFSSSINHTYLPRNKGKPVLGGNNRLFFPINEEDAEKLSTSYDKLYFAVKGEIYGYARGPGTDFPTSFFIGVTPAYDVTGESIEFYTDDLLTNRVFKGKVSLIK